MTKWIVRESSSGKMYQLTIKGSNSENVYKLFAEKIYKMDTSGDFDTGNVDIDIEKVVPQKENEIIELFTEE